MGEGEILADLTGPGMGRFFMKWLPGGIKIILVNNVFVRILLQKLNNSNGGYDG